MHVDEPGRHDGSLGIEDVGAAGIQVFADARDAAVANQNVAHGIQAARRIDDASATKKKIVHRSGAFTRTTFGLRGKRTGVRPGTQ